MKQPAFSAAALRNRRETANVTRQQLAHGAGLSLTTLADLETGRITSPLGSTVVALAQALGCSVEDLYAAEADDEDRPGRRTPRRFGHLQAVPPLAVSL